jgi:hypothetical protein
LIALRGAFNWRGNGRGLREEAVAGAFDGLKGEEGAEGGERPAVVRAYSGRRDAGGRGRG